ncbi:hypothetical protein EB836_10550 [Brevibacterium sp. S111]|nr:hypothetical protein EB836_10550 [Brevibacterium sp. S111]
MSVTGGTAAFAARSISGTSLRSMLVSIDMLIRPSAYSLAASSSRARSAAACSSASRTRSFQSSSGPTITAKLSGFDNHPSSTPVT